MAEREGRVLCFARISWQAFRETSALLSLAQVRASRPIATRHDAVAVGVGSLYLELYFRGIEHRLESPVHLVVVDRCFVP